MTTNWTKVKSILNSIQSITARTNVLSSSTAFSQMGFSFSPDFTKQLTKKSHDHKEVSVDEFIVLCVTVQRLTEAFRQRDAQQNGIISINFEDFLSVVLTNTNWLIHWELALFVLILFLFSIQKETKTKKFHFYFCYKFSYFYECYWITEESHSDNFIHFFVLF